MSHPLFNLLNESLKLAGRRPLKDEEFTKVTRAAWFRVLIFSLGGILASCFVYTVSFGICATVLGLDSNKGLVAGFILYLATGVANFILRQAEKKSDTINCLVEEAFDLLDKEDKK